MNRSFRLPRLWSNAVLAEIAPLFDGSVINVSGWDDRDKAGGRYRDYFRRASSYSISNHVGERGLAEWAGGTDLQIDLETTLDSDLVGRFDVVFNHTALEHIYDLNTAFANLCRLSSDVVIVVVPFAQELHCTASYGDYWRFTPMSLRRLFDQNHLTVVFEAASRHRNAGIYLLIAASRHPQRWNGKFPDWQPVEVLGQWIGATMARRFRSLLNRLRRAVGFGR
jgi:hypothetical protein